MFLFNNRCETTSILRSEITYQWVEPSLASGACDLRAFSLVPSRFQSPTKSQTSRFDCCTDNLLSSIGDQNTRLGTRGLFSAVGVFGVTADPGRLLPPPLFASLCFRPDVCLCYRRLPFTDLFRGASPLTRHQPLESVLPCWGLRLSCVPLHATRALPRT